MIVFSYFDVTLRDVIGLRLKPTIAFKLGAKNYCLDKVKFLKCIFLDLNIHFSPALAETFSLNFLLKLVCKCVYT